MDPDFQRALTVVLLVGTVIVAVGATVLFIVFRGFGGKRAGGTSHMVLMAALIAFVILCCAVLFIWSYR